MITDGFRRGRSNSGVHKSYIRARIDQWLSAYLATHSKIFFIRMSIRFPKGYTYDASYPYISRFSQKLSQYFSRNGFDPAYFWCREQLSSDVPHFHYCFMVDGQKAQRPVAITAKANSLWQSTLGTNSKGLVNYDHCVSIRKNERDYPERLNMAIEWAYYLCKAYSKGDANDGYRDFGMSRLNERADAGKSVTIP